MSLTVKEIASTTARLLIHLDRLKELKESHRLRPITIHLAPTNKCNLNCEWCSVRNRDKALELPLPEIKDIIHMYYRLGIKSVEITGGGEPTIHPDLEEIIYFAKQLKLDVGLITNGLHLNAIEDEALKLLTWLRISLSGVEFNLDHQYLDLDPTRFPPFTGCSYVFTRKSHQIFSKTR